MRKIVLLYIIAALGICGCDDFLNVKPRDTKVVKDIGDYRDLMAPYVANLKAMTGTINVWGSYYTSPWDPCITNLLPGYIGEVVIKNDYNKNNGQLTDTYQVYYAWKSSSSSALWTKLYSLVGPLNMIIGEIDDAEGDDNDLRNRVKGEALYWRAYAFFKLVQYFSPYKDNHLGVPVFLDTHVDAAHGDLHRRTQQEAYDRVVADCLSGLELLKQTQPRKSYNVAYKASAFNALLAAAYHFKALSGAAEVSDWSNAEKYASAAMTGRELSGDPEVLQSIFDLKNPQAFESDEFDVRVIKTDAIGRYMLGFFGNMYGGCPANNEERNYITSPDILNMFSDDDIRKQVWFTTKSQYTDKACNNKYRQSEFSKTSGGGVIMPFRLAELCLIRAEALLMQDKLSEGSQALKDFMEKRYTNAVTLPSDKEGMLNVLYAERRKEFFHEWDINFLDMKRLQKSYSRNIRGNEFEISGDAFQYTFPIPFSEIKNNPQINENNPGWDAIVTE